jgi:hypothetical protein
MEPSVSSTGTLESGPTRPPLSARRLAIVGTALLAAAGVIAVVTRGSDQKPVSPEIGFVETWINAWNDRDAQVVSSMTCDYIPAFVPAGIIEDSMARVPHDRPVVADHTVTSTEPAVAYDREGVRVYVSFVSGARPEARDTSVFVRVRDSGDMCIGQLSTW